MSDESIRLEDDADVVAAWKAALGLGRRIGFGAFKQNCLSGAVLELCRELVERGGRGSCSLVDSSDASGPRARVVIDGCPPELAAAARGRGSKEFHVGPAMPAVKLHQVAETLHVDTAVNGSSRLVVTFHQAQALNRPSSQRPAAFGRGRLKPAPR